MTETEEEELPNPIVLERLSRLLPLHCVNVRTEARGLKLSYVRSLVVQMLGNALDNGHLIDRTNSDGPLAEWDGWLVIRGAKDKTTFIETNWKTKQL